MAYNKETGMYEGFIYKITNIDNNHFYIGQTRRTISERFYDHTKDCTIKRYQEYGLYKAMRKHGINSFIIEELEKYECETEYELNNILNKREYHLVTTAKQKYGKEYVYNHSDGGDYDGCSITRIPVIQYDLFCNEINRYNTIKDARIKTGCTNISGVVNKNGQCLSSGGFIWRKASDPLTEEEKRELRIHFDTMPIKQYCCGLEPLREFKNSEEAAHYVESIVNSREISIRQIKSGIRQCCSHSNKTAYGFVWRYLGDDEIYDGSYEKCILAVEQRENGTGKLLNTFISCSDAERITGVDGSIISQCCNHNLSLAGGFLWNRCGDYDPSILMQIKHKPIVQLSKNNEYINIYDSPTHASKLTGINRSDICGACNGKLKSAGGYHWQYVYEYYNISNEEVKYA